MEKLSEIYTERGLQDTILQLPEPLQRYSVDIERATVYDNHTQKHLKGCVNKMGYTCYHLDEHGKIRTIRVHRLIGYAVCGRILDKCECISHDDEGFGVGKVNNHYKNLSICTQKENMGMPSHRKRLRGSQHSKPIVVCKKGTLSPIGTAYSMKQLCRQLKLNASNIRECMNGNRAHAYGFSFYRLDAWLRQTEGEGQKILDYYLI